MAFNITTGDLQNASASASYPHRHLAESFTHAPAEIPRLFGGFGLNFTHDTNGLLQIDALENYAEHNKATPLYCLYNYSSGVDARRHWHCCQRPLRAEELGCSLTSAGRIREAIKRRGKRTFDFAHRWSSTIPWQCMASCPKMRDAFNEARNPSSLQLQSEPVNPFPLIDLDSYYPELPPYRSRSGLARLPLLNFSDGVDDEMAEYDIEVVEYDDSLAEYYNLNVGIPRAINITDLGFEQLR